MGGISSVSMPLLFFLAELFFGRKNFASKKMGGCQRKVRTIMKKVGQIGSHLTLTPPNLFGVQILLQKNAIFGVVRTLR